jgi:hypothetical protein
MRAKVTIQTTESVVSEGSVFEELDVEYELTAGNDINDKLHDKLIADIYRFWSENPLDNSVVGEKSVTLEGGSYVIFSGTPDYPKLVWFDGRFFQLEFKQFLKTKKSGFGALGGFWRKKIRFYEGNGRVKLEMLINGRQSEFLRLYKEGRFTRHQN